MRRKDKEVTDRTVIESIILRSSVCRLALSGDNRPYVVPLCFGYKDSALYVHSAREGTKLDILKKNNYVCFEFDIDHKIVRSDNACGWGMNYWSVIGFGRASFIKDLQSKREALDVIMQHYSGRSFAYPEATVKNTVVIKIEIESMTAKKSGY